MAIFSGIAAIVGGIASAIGGAIGAVSTFVGGLGITGASLLKTAVGIGANLLASAIAGKNKAQTASFSVKGQLQSGGTVPRSFILGMSATAGSLAYANSWGNEGGTPNAYVTQVIALSDAPVKDLLAVVVNGILCQLDLNEPHAEFGWPVIEYRLNGTDYLWIKFHDGNQTVADSFLVNRVSSSDRPYESTRVAFGVAYAIATSRINQELFTGFPSFKFVIDGIRLYDPSKDSLEGGDGPQRWSDPSTWGGDGDHLPAVQAYNLLRGIRWNDQWLYGLQTLSGRRVPHEHWRGQAALCRALIDGPDGPEATYRSGAEVGVNAVISDAFAGILTSGNGRLAEIGGTYKAYFGAPGEPVMSFTDGDILSTEGQTFTPFFGLSSTVNGVSASYPSPDDGWNMVEAPALYNEDFETEDGGRRLLADVSLDFAPYNGQVQRLMQSALAEARRARRHTHSMPPAFWVLEPGDVVEWTSARNGYVAKRFRVDGVLDLPNLDVVLDITEVDPADYHWNQATDYRPPTSGSLSPGWPAPQVMAGWTVVASNIEGKRPAIQVGCAADLDDVARIWVQVRVKATGAVVFDSDSAVYAPPFAWLLSGAWCLSLTTYEVRGKYVPYSSRATEWGGWLEVTTGNYSETDLMVSLADLNADVIAQFTDLQSQMRHYLLPTIERLSVAFATLAAGAQLTRESMLAELGSARAEITDESFVRATENEAMAGKLETVRADFASNVAQVQQLITALTDAQEATAQLVTQLNASVAGNAAAITAEQTARVNGDNALASSISSVSAQYNEWFAQGLIRFEAVAAPGGVDARFAILVRGGTSDAYKTSGLYIDLFTVAGVQKSRVAILADQFVVTDGSSTSSPMAFEDGELKALFARFGTITTAIMQGTNGKMVLNVQEGYIIINA